MNAGNNKKIDIVVMYFYPVAAGIETNVLETYKVLVEKGWDVTVHTSNLEYTTGEILPDKENVEGIKVRRYPLNLTSFSPKVPYNKTDLVCLHNFDILPHLFILVWGLFHKLLGRKNYSIVLTPHGGFNPEWRVFSKFETVIKYLYTYTVGVVLINLVVDAVRAVSEWEKEEMVKAGLRRDKITVISNGIEDDAFDDIEGKSSKEIQRKVHTWGDYLVQIGRVYPIKNYETTIQALTNIPGGIKYVIVGPVSDRKYLADLEKLASDLGLEDRVIFAGVIREIDKYYVIKHAKAMVHMAIWESFCNVVHEGMSQGLPVIAADNTALSFLVEDGVNGFLVDTRDYKEVAERINFILDKENLDAISSMSRAGISFAKENSWSKTAEKMNELYSYLINK